MNKIQYAVIHYTYRPDDDNIVQVKHVTDNFDYANKLAFHYAKKTLPLPMYGPTECRIAKNYPECSCIYMGNKTIVDYRICEVVYNDEINEYQFDKAWFNVWAVVEFNNDTENEKIDDIDEEIIYEH